MKVSISSMTGIYMGRAPYFASSLTRVDKMWTIVDKLK